MIKCLIKMKTRCLLLGILYGAGMFNSFSNSEGIVIPGDEGSFTYSVNTTSWTQNSSSPKPNVKNENVEGPKICEQQIITYINSRYASTVVTTRIRNLASTAKEYTFSFLLPNNAFLTGFIIEINGKNFTSYVLEDKEARKQFKSAGQLSESTQVRNTQNLSIPINLEALSITTLYLTYEELLIRNHGRYEHVLNIFPGQVVENLLVEIFLKETGKITNLKVPNLRTGYEIDNHYEELDPQAFISENRHSGVVISFKVLFMPNEEEQRKFARVMKTDENRGFAGQFVVQYDVENHKEFGEILVSSGYFVNFFAPKGLAPLAKHVVFVLDTSGSMRGKRIEHLKMAMKQMLNQLRENDLMSLVEFNANVKVWNLESKEIVTYERSSDITTIKFPKPFLATPANIKKAIDCVNKFTATFDTDILSGLKTGLKLVELGTKFDKFQRQPLIMFLTDGQPSVGVTTPKLIKEEVSKLNQGSTKSPISTLAFGNSANEDFLQTLATLNDGYFKHIYDADDSQLQIESFFNTISVPVLANVNFKYNISAFRDITITKFPVCYDGSELIVAGEFDNTKVFEQPVIEALSNNGPLDNQVLHVYNSTTEISHHWAFLTTKQLLNKIRINSENNPKEIKKVLEVCTKYSYVTSFTSMVIVKPNENFVLGTAKLTEQSTSKPTINEKVRYVAHR